MNQLLKQVLLVLCMFALSGQVIAGSLTDAARTYDAGNYADAAKQFRALAEQGNAVAQARLGVLYEQGRGVPQDFQEAYKWIRLSVAQGNADAQFTLGWMYELGEGVPQDIKEAINWYRLSAKQGNGFAQFSLGGMYAHGQGVPKNFVAGHMWTNICAANATDSDLLQLCTKLRDSLTKIMTSAQIAEAQELARKCTANKFKGC